MSKNGYADTLQQTQDINRMTTAKILMTLFGWFGIPLYIYAYIVNLDNTKSSILFIVALCITLIRVYYWVVRTKQNGRLKELEIQRQQNEIIKEKLAEEEKRIELLERELSINITGLTEQQRQERRNRNNY